MFLALYVGMKRYRGRLSYLPVTDTSLARLSSADDASENSEGPLSTPLLAPLDQPVPEDWITVDEEFVLVGAIYQSHLAKDNLMASSARLADGVIHLLWTKSFLATRIGKIAETTHTHPFNGPLSGTTWVSRYQKGKTNLDFPEARDSEWQWHQLGRMQVCTLLERNSHASTPPLSFLQARCPSCRPTNSVKALEAKIAETKVSFFAVYFGWLGSRVVSVLDSGAEGPGFKSQPRLCRVTVLGKLFTPIVPGGKNGSSTLKGCVGNCRPGGK